MEANTFSTPISLKKVAENCRSEVNQEQQNVEVSGWGTIENNRQGQIICFYRESRKDQMAAANATAVLTTEKLKKFVPSHVIPLIVEDPRIALADVLLACVK